MLLGALPMGPSQPALAGKHCGVTDEKRFPQLVDGGSAERGEGGELSTSYFSLAARGPKK